MSFTNWAPNNPKTSSSSTANICVQMNSDELVRGKWANEPCTKKNLVVCERKQKWTLEKMQEVIERQHEQNEKLQKTIEQLQGEGKENREANEQLQKTIEQLQKEGKRNRETNEKMQREIEKLTKNHIPIGFVYVQLPKEKSPQEIWSSEIKWTDVSSTCENIFFRVVGSKTEAFGKVQEDFSPYIDKVSYFCQGKYETNSACSYAPRRTFLEVAAGRGTSTQ